jgi:flagellar motility protein MotE (MotC chaperone)
MNRIVEIAAMAIGGLSLFLVAFVGFASLSGRDVSRIAVIGRLFPAPQDPAGEPGAEEGSEDAPPEHDKGLSDAAVIEASLGVLSAWTLPSPYSTSELRVLSEELKKKRGELEERERAPARREHAVQDGETELGERLKSLEELRAQIEGLQGELSERESEVQRRENAIEAGQDAGWAEVANVLATIEETPEAAKKLGEYEPGEAAKILRALGDDARAGEILNAIAPTRWKEYVDAYTAEKSRAGAKKKTKK